MVLHYICRGNALRSILAEAYTKSLQIPGLEVTSSGTVASQYRVHSIPVFALTQAILEAHDMHTFAKDHFAEDLTQQDLNESDTVVCMDPVVYDEAVAICQLPFNTYVWDIQDIDEALYSQGTEAEKRAFMEATFASIRARVDDFVRANDVIAQLTRH